MPTVSVENYLKAILHLEEGEEGRVSTTAIAEKVGATPASASAMMSRLGDRGWVEHERYYGVSLTEKGQRIAMEILRRHRLWERFLVDHLGFEWDQVHEIAEELEHVDSRELVNRLDAFLGFPKLDPHGDAIPGPNGRFRSVAARTLLAEAPRNLDLVVVGVVDGGDAFLRHLGVLGIELGSRLTVMNGILLMAACTFGLPMSMNFSCWRPLYVRVCGSIKATRPRLLYFPKTTPRHEWID